ncbi:MAG: hypothetical protein ACI9CA_000968 [Natronomonas sp.]|jgi:hypothetical protein
MRKRFITVEQICPVDEYDATCSGDAEDDTLRQVTAHAEDAHPDLALDDGTVATTRDGIGEGEPGLNRPSVPSLTNSASYRRSGTARDIDGAPCLLCPLAYSPEPNAHAVELC